MVRTCTMCQADQPLEPVRWADPDVADGEWACPACASAYLVDPVIYPTAERSLVDAA